MIDTNNKPLLVLIGMNILLFMVIFWLIGMLMGRESGQPVQTAAVSTPRVVSESVMSAETKDPGQAVSQPAADDPAGEPEMVEKVRTINVFYDGGLVRMEESDNQGNMHVQISNSLKEIDKIAPQDEGYVAALEDLKQGKRKHVSMIEVTHEAARKEVVAQPAGKPGIVDRFNKVDVSGIRSAPGSMASLSLVEQIENVVAAEEELAPPAAGTDPEQADLEEYVQTLDTESVERANEMRTIQVRRGDSLWAIAVRAYGSGFEYPRIFKANPHLKNPDLITEGETLRVPL